jgi:hypothetical protein
MMRWFVVFDRSEITGVTTRVLLCAGHDDGKSRREHEQNQKGRDAALRRPADGPVGHPYQFVFHFHSR